MSTLKRDSMEAISNLSNQVKATTLSNPQPQRPPVRAGLTTLPASILNTIFSHLLDTELVNTGKENVSYTHTLSSSGTLQFKASRSPFSVCTALFYVCKNISATAIRYFYAQNLFIRFTLRTPDARHAKTMLADSGVLFSVAGSDVLDRVKQHAMDLGLTEKESTHCRSVVMFPAQYLPRLVNFMDQASKATSSWASAHKLEINVLNTYTFPVSRVQGDLLEPFRFLTNFSSASISSKHILPAYAAGLEKNITSSFTATSWLATITSLADRGDEAKEKKDWEISRQHYHSAIIALTYAYLTHPEDLHSQNDQGETFAKNVQRLRWRCEFNIGRIILEQNNYARPHLTPKPLTASLTAELARDLLAAETALSAALSLATNSPSPTSNPWIATLPVDLVPPNSEAWFTDAERAECWFQLGLSHASLKEYLFAAGDMERAVRLLDEEGSKGEIEEVFGWVRGAIDWKVPPGTGLRRAAVAARSAV